MTLPSIERTKAETGDDWQPIATAPKDGTRIRIKPRYGLPEMDGQWRVYEGGRAGFGFIMGRDVDPTHWRPVSEGERP